jgi:transcriptional regulator with XRE-family HTH domain
MKATLGSQPPSDDDDTGRSGRIRDANKGTGERIRLARKWAGLNQDEVATRMGLSRASISNWELGQGIKRGNLLSFAQIAGVSAEWLMTGEPNLAPRGEKASDQASVSGSVIDVVQLERLIAAAFELLGKPSLQDETPRSISNSNVRVLMGAKDRGRPAERRMSGSSASA